MDSEETREGAERAPARSCGGGCCCGGVDTRTPEERRACDAKRATLVMRFFIWGVILAALVVLAVKGF